MHIDRFDRKFLKGMNMVEFLTIIKVIPQLTNVSANEDCFSDFCTAFSVIWMHILRTTTGGGGEQVGLRCHRTREFV